MTHLLKRQLLILVVALSLLVAALPAVAVAAPPSGGYSGNQIAQFHRPGRNDYTRGFRAGYREGYRSGFRDGRDLCRRHGERRHRSFSSGQDDYDRGYAAGFSQGYDAGFAFGCRRGRP